MRRRRRKDPPTTVLYCKICSYCVCVWRLTGERGHFLPPFPLQPPSTTSAEAARHAPLLLGTLETDQLTLTGVIARGGRKASLIGLHPRQTTVVHTLL